MPLLSYFLPSYKRPKLLGYTIAMMQEARVPDGWELEIVVCAPTDECEGGWPCNHEVRFVSAERTDVGSQYEGARRACRGEILMQSGDDDLQSIHRPCDALMAHRAGAQVSGYNLHYRVNTQTGDCALWEGPAQQCGDGVNYAFSALEAAGGWEPCERYADSQIRRKLDRLNYTCLEIAPDFPSIHLYHGEQNLSQGMPWPAPGEMQRLGDFVIKGLGHYSTAIMCSTQLLYLDEICKQPA